MGNIVFCEVIVCSLIEDKCHFGDTYWIHHHFSVLKMEA
jgi:hypothetical protein